MQSLPEKKIKFIPITIRLSIIEVLFWFIVHGFVQETNLSGVINFRFQNIQCLKNRHPDPLRRQSAGSTDF